MIDGASNRHVLSKELIDIKLDDSSIYIGIRSFPKTSKLANIGQIDFSRTIQT